MDDNSQHAVITFRKKPVIDNSILLLHLYLWGDMKNYTNAIFSPALSYFLQSWEL